MILASADWRVTPMVVNGVPTLTVERSSPYGWMLPADRGSGRCTTVEQVRAILGEDAFAALEPA